MTTHLTSTYLLHVRMYPCSSKSTFVFTFGLAFIFAALLQPCFAKENVKPHTPNIVIIMADDLGYGDLGCYGQDSFATPNIDRLATEGMLFTQHYAGSTVCAPSRATLLTGQHTGHVYQRANGQLQFREDPQDICVAKYLKSAGYHTAMIGKSGLSCNSEDGSLPNRKGFDHFFGYVSHVEAHRYYPPRLWRNGEEIKYPNNHGKKGEEYSGDLFLKDTLEYLDQRNTERVPFFLHVSLQQPHADLSVPKEWIEPFVGKFQEKPYRGGHYRSVRYPKSTYAGMINYLDTSVGKIVTKIDELGMSDNTLVIFTSDNGAMSEGGWSRHYFKSSGILRGGKRDLYEGGIRVPMIARWPGTIKAGSKSEHISAFWDYMPTVCELAGTTCPNNTDGVSFLPTLLGNKDQPSHEFLYWEFHEEGGKQAVRWGDWKGVRLKVNKNSNGPIELFNLETDPSESENVAKQHPEIVAKIEEVLKDAHEPGVIVKFKGEERMANR